MKINIKSHGNKITKEQILSMMNIASANGDIKTYQKLERLLK